MALRNVISTNAGLDVSTEYSEGVEELVNGDSINVERRTEIRDQWGQLGCTILLVSYPAPDTGDTVWAVDYEDNDSREVEEGADRAEVDAKYLEYVGHSSADLGHDREGNEKVWDTTDVPTAPGYKG